MPARSYAPVLILAALVACSTPDEATSTPQASASSGAAGASTARSAASEGPVSVREEGGRLVVRYTGELAGRAGLTLRYGFDGWSELGDLPYTSGGDSAGSSGGAGKAGKGKGKGKSGGLSAKGGQGSAVVFSLEAAMTASGDGAEVTITPPSGARALHMTFHAGSNTDDDGGREHHWGLTFPYIGPFLTWNDRARPHDGVVVNFEVSSTAAATVEYGAGSLSERATSAGGDTMQHVALTGLKPDTEYSYRVVGADGRTSPTYSFHTLAADQREYTFVVAADMQDDGRSFQRWGQVAAQIQTTAPDARLVFTPGDLAADDAPGFWWLFFDRGRDLFASVPIVPTVGNHDTPGSGSSDDASSYTRYFDLPAASGSETYYALDVGQTTFISLNSERPEQLAAGGVQRTWLDGALADASGADWVFAGFHHPPYDAGSRFASVQGEYRGVTQAFDGAVDWVFLGHEHLYQRFEPMRYDARVVGEYGRDGGVGYLIAPSAGNRLFERVVGGSSPYAGMRDRLAYPAVSAQTQQIDGEHGFVVVDVAPKSMTIQAIGMGDSAGGRVRVRDEVTVKR